MRSPRRAQLSEVRHRAEGLLIRCAETTSCDQTPQDPRDWRREDIDHFHRLLVCYQHAHRLPDAFIEREATVALYEFLRPGITAQMMRRRALGTTLLRKVALRAKNENTGALRSQQQKFRGRVNLLSDVWQNIVKSHLLAIQLTLLGVLYTFDVVAVGSNHDGVSIARDLETQLQRVLLAGFVVGAIVTDNAGQCARARRILALRWTNIVFLHCFAHAVNNLVKSVLNAAFRETATSAASVVNAINGSSSKWLVRVKAKMVSTYGQSWSLLALCDTRWNSMQGNFASLLRAKTALEEFHEDHKDDADFPPTFQVLGDPSFWQQLEEAERVIRPLSFASYKLQRDENTVADVIYCYGWIYRGFAQNENHREALVSCIEARWAECEQPLFMLGFFLHPAYFDRASALASTLLTTPHNLSQLSIYYYRRLLEKDPETIGNDFTEWRASNLSQVSRSEYASPADYWCAVREELQRTGRSTELPDLAIIILSIAVNTATCERLFSELGLIHTAIRNRMSSVKALLIHWVRKLSRTGNEHKRQRANLKRIINPKERRVLQAGGDRTAGSDALVGDERSAEEDPDGPFLLHFVDEIMQDDEMLRDFPEFELRLRTECEDQRTIIFNIDGNEKILRSKRKKAIPNQRVKDYPQELMVPEGLRGYKVKLAEVFRIGSETRSQI